ncbi:MAG: Ig-like domain-containing protein [Actinomycetota bacterium]|nr:Ig-like domain-containing protein [Actinomycetota bacterium]
MALLGGVLQTASATSIFQGITPSKTELSADPSAVVVGETITYKAKVSDLAGIGATPSGGTVKFEDGTASINETDSQTETTTCDARPIDSNGDATCTTTHSSAGLHSITATYTGDAVYTTSFGTLEQTVDKADTTTTLEPASVSAVATETVTYTATVTVDSPGSGPLTGDSDSVAFKRDGTDIPSCATQSVDTSTGVATATCIVTFGAADIGTHSITAVYSGDVNYNQSPPSTGVTETVIKASTTTTLTPTPNPAKTTESVTYSVTVEADPPATGTPSGEVTFKDGGTAIPTTASCVNPATLVNGEAQCTVSPYSSAGTHVITAEYSGDLDGIYDVSSHAVNQVIRLPYGLAATANSSSDPTNASFRISGAPRLANYRLCVKYLRYSITDNWPAVTPPPKQGSGIHRFGLNFEGKCKKQSWGRGTSHTERLMDTKLGSDDFGFATRGTYEVRWFTCGNGKCTSNGQLIGTDTFTWNSWCPPNVGGFRQMGVWRTSRHKVRDSCSSGTGRAGGLDSHFDKDRSVSWNGWHNEFVARDWIGSYGAPSRGAIGANGNGWGSGWRRYVGVWVCDRYHKGKSELHPMFMAEESNGRRYVGGPQYSTKTPSISGTWRLYAC